MSKEVTSKELSNMIFDTMRAKTILANQNALAYNEVLSKTPIFKQKIKNLGNPFIKELINLEKMEFAKIDKAENTLEAFKGQNVIDQAFERSNRIIILLAKMVFVDYDDVELVLKALASDRKSMIGIAKKTINNKH
jgi:hypothetical protein